MYEAGMIDNMSFMHIFFKEPLCLLCFKQKIPSHKNTLRKNVFLWLSLDGNPSMGKISINIPMFFIALGSS